MRKYFLGIALVMALTSNCQTDSEFLVGLKNGKVLKPNTLEFKQPTFGKAHLLIDGETKMELDKVKYYQDKSGYYVWSWVNGQEVRLKRELEGKVSVYTRTVSTYTPGMPMSGGFSAGVSGSQKLSYFQKGNSSMQKINYLNLESALKDNQASAQHLDKVKSLNNANTIAYVVGGALLVGGLVHMGELNKQDGPPPYDDISIKFSPLLIGSVAAFTIPLFNKSPKNRNLEQAIRAYNR